jgi:hypothetical protein
MFFSAFKELESAVITAAAAANAQKYIHSLGLSENPFDITAQATAPFTAISPVISARFISVLTDTKYAKAAARKDSRIKK